MAETTSLNCLSCRILYQCPHSLCEKALRFTDFCYVASPSPNSVPTPCDLSHTRHEGIQLNEDRDWAVRGDFFCGQLGGSQPGQPCLDFSAQRLSLRDLCGSALLSLSASNIQLAEHGGGSLLADEVLLQSTSVASDYSYL